MPNYDDWKLDNVERFPDNQDDFTDGWFDEYQERLIEQAERKMDHNRDNYNEMPMR